MGHWRMRIGSYTKPPLLRNEELENWLLTVPPRLKIADYLMGRDALYPQELTPEILKNAEHTVAMANALLAVLNAKGITPETHPQTQTFISSGWRPPQINGQVKGAAVRSKHMTGQAIDIYDPEGEIDDYLMSDEGQRALAALGLYLEAAPCTKGWSHWQTVAPKSGRRTFFP